MAKAVMVRIAQLERWNDQGKSWSWMARKLGISASTIQRVWDEGEDREVTPKPRRGKKVDLEIVNEALEADGIVVADPALALQAKLTSLVRGLRKRKVTKLVLDLDRGEAEVHYTHVQRIKVGGDE